jgi:hypothetical protein
MTDRRFDSVEISRMVKKLGRSELKQMETAIWTDPNGVYEHCLLIGFHYKMRNEEDRLRHVLWLIENHPEHSFLFWPECAYFHSSTHRAVLLDQWKKASSKNADNGLVLRNMASFCAFFDIRRSIEILEELRRKEPGSAIVDLEYKIYLTSLSERTANKDELTKLRRDCEELLGTYPNDPMILEALVRVCLEEQDFQNVSRYAQLLIAGNQKNHLGHTALGLAYLSTGQTDKAKEELQASMNWNTAWRFPYNFALASALLKTGERGVVCKYLLSLWNKWRMGRAHILLWLFLIGIGVKPKLSL